jgi:hypothetical protein
MHLAGNLAKGVHTSPEAGRAGIPGRVCTKHERITFREFVTGFPREGTTHTAQFRAKVGHCILFTTVVLQPRFIPAPAGRAQRNRKDV